MISGCFADGERRRSFTMAPNLITKWSEAQRADSALRAPGVWAAGPAHCPSANLSERGWVRSTRRSIQPELRKSGGGSRRVAQATCLGRAATCRAERKRALVGLGASCSSSRSLPSARLVAVPPIPLRLVCDTAGGAPRSMESGHRCHMVLPYSPAQRSRRP